MTEGIAQVYINKINTKKYGREIRFRDEEESRIIDTIENNWNVHNRKKYNRK